MIELVPPKDRQFYSIFKTVQEKDFLDDVDGFGEYIDFEVEFDD